MTKTIKQLIEEYSADALRTGHVDVHIVEQMAEALKESASLICEVIGSYWAGSDSAGGGYNPGVPDYDALKAWLKKNGFEE